MPREFQFDLSGGSACLDFANTSSSQREPGTQQERLHTYSDLLAFSSQSGLISAAQAREIASYSHTHPAEANRALRKAFALRETIYRIFAAVAASRTPSPRELESLNVACATAVQYSRLVRSNDRYHRTWTNHGGNPLEVPLWPIALSACDLLQSGALGNLRECGSGDCSWLFVDQSRNQSRRWCDMKTCGNRAKARRHYARVSS